jgi:hypothetical protein
MLLQQGPAGTAAPIDAERPLFLLGNRDARVYRH